MVARVCLVVLLCLVGTLSTSPHCAGALLAQQGRPDPVMPEPGNPDHVQPPDGAFCDHSARASHACACHAKCVEDEQGNVTLQEDGTHCRANCFRKFCRCPADGCKTPSPSIGR